MKKKKKPPTPKSQHELSTERYSEFGIQPIDYAFENNLDFFQGNVVKYITRHKVKEGLEDVKKAMHYCVLLAEREYGVKLMVDDLTGHVIEYGRVMNPFDKELKD